MTELAGVAERLRMVREAHRKFLYYWALEVVSQDAARLDRIARDVEQFAGEPVVADPHQVDWSSLYRGSVLDD
jgi:hypothetical protein